ncbi:isoprenylcysteine carboxyl methyltransferase family protein [Amnibacterium sp.]|uniref:isoprenylcysteine carboxyl methyltransferase family protein n=1 Tax=Amnibacterium sp. TaxID=1872496 RepID=UPI0039C86318
MAAFTHDWWIAYWWYLALLAGAAAERFLELVISRRNLGWALAHGGREEGIGHFPAMVALHSALGVACVLEPLLAPRPFLPALGITAVVLVLASQALRYWCILTLGHRWNTRIVVVPGLPLVRRGPYRFLSHPNYVAVALEGIALPLVFTSWVTAVAFTVLNAVLLLRFRIPAEEAAMSRALAESRS